MLLVWRMIDGVNDLRPTRKSMLRKWYAVFGLSILIFGVAWGTLAIAGALLHRKDSQGKKDKGPYQLIKSFRDSESIRQAKSGKTVQDGTFDGHLSLLLLI